MLFFVFFASNKQKEKRKIYQRRHGSGKYAITDQKRQSCFAKNIPAEEILPAHIQ